jgi:hypothetical protein
VEMMIIVESSLPKTPGEHWQQLRQGSARTDDQILIHRAARKRSLPSDLRDGQEASSRPPGVA